MVRVDMKMPDQRFRAWIAVGIERPVRLAAAAQKPLQPQRVAIAGRADDDRPARAAFQQTDAAQDQRPHDPLAEACLLHHQVAQPLRGNDEGLDRLFGLGIDQRRTAGKLRKLADEIARTMGDDGLAPAGSDILGDVDRARQENDQPRRDSAGGDDMLAGGIGTRLAEPAHALNIGLGQDGKHLVAAGDGDWTDGRGHG